MAQQPSQQKLQCGRAFVKLVSSGDQITVRGQPRGGPPKEKLIIFSDLDAGKTAKRANANASETSDSEYAWTARENLRKKIVGKEVYFKVHDSTNSARPCSYGVVYLGTDETSENLTEWSVASGNCKLRDTVQKTIDREKDKENADVSHLQKLIDLENDAKNKKIGRWAEPPVKQRSNIKWTITDAEQFVESNRKVPVPAILEHVFNASMLRLYLPSENAYITMSLTGIRAPTAPGGVEEEFFALARYTVESKLLNKDVHVMVEGVAPNLGRQQKEPLFVGTIQHPCGNISELLLKEGFAKCVDWSMGMLVGDASKYRNAERSAKMARKRLWKNWEPADANIPENERDFSGKVTQIINSDSLNIDDGTTVKQIFLSSIRPARIDDLPEEMQKKARANEKGAGKSKALYTVPFLFEAREFLRKKLIGKKVQVKVDYKRPAVTEGDRSYPERLCATVTFQGSNIAEALVSKGIAVPIKHRHEDDNRSSKYDDLREAERAAQKAQKGIFSNSLPDPMRVSDVSQEIPKARAFMPFLKGKKSDAVVDHVFSGSRLKLYIPKETCLLTFLVGGIECPRLFRPARDGQPAIAGDEYGQEAADLTKELCQQKDVVVEVESMDKVGGFIGYCFVDKVNVSLKLVEAGLCKVHYSGEQGKYANELLAAQERAQNARLKMWKNWEPPKEEKIVVTNGKVELTSRTMDLKEIVITEVTPTMCFYGQYTANGEQLETLTKKMRAHFAENQPTAGAYKAKRNDVCAAIFPEDGLWYRGKVEKVSRDGKDLATITFIDYGNRAQVPTSKLAVLPAEFSPVVLEGQAVEFQLALVKPPVDEDSMAIALDQFISKIMGDQTFSVNDENMKEGNTYQVTLMSKDGVDIGEELLKNGFCTTVKKAPKHLAELHSTYVEVQSVAKKQHLNLWRYGDITEDDDKEFGMNNETVKAK